MLLPVSKAYHQACVAVLGPSGAIFGTGVAIGGDRFATCAHVVAQALGRGPNARRAELPTDLLPQIRQPYISGAESEPLEVKIEAFRSRAESGGFADIAILALASTVPEALRRRAGEMPRFSVNAPILGEPLFVTGFPNTPGVLKSTSGHASYLAVAPHDNEWIGIEGEKGFGSEIRPGFSGAPVWSHVQRAIVGLVCEADWGRRTAAIIPNAFLRRLAKLPEAADPSAAVEAASPEATRVYISVPTVLRRALDAAAPGLHRWLTLEARVLSRPDGREPIAEALRELAVAFEAEIAERTYLPPPARQLPRMPEQPSFRPIRQLIREVSGGSSGGDGADAYISALSRRSRHIADLMGTLRRSRQPIILLGDPGAGKSLTLQQVAISFARREEKRVYPSLCIFLRLGRWEPIREPAVPAASAVRDLVTSVCPRPLMSALNELDRQGRLLVIFDGMDEMSRYRYVEHTRALDLYAGEADGRIRTLFSCRIADFAPTFRHRRLVLLPFDKRHVQAYLHRQFAGAPIEVDGRSLTTRELSEHLVSEELAVRATNPYVLYLLSIYIQNNKSIPTRRTDLLRYYFSFAIERKEAELKQKGLPTDRDALFGLWARAALAITEANEGSDIRRTELDLQLGPEAETAVRAGQVAGVLVESLDRDPEAPALIRFESHRAQEFFTAHAIATSGEHFDWSARLDVPRWQETLVNVAQMGKAGGAIEDLACTLEAVHEIWDNVDDPGRRIWKEVEAAERVDVAARVVRDLPSSPQRERLRSLVTGAAGELMQKGAVVAKAAVLRTVQQAPEVGGEDLIAPALKHESSWLRDQAYVVQSRVLGAKGSQSVISEIGLAYAKGELPGRLLRYLALARKLKSPTVGVVAVAGATLQILALALAAAVGPALVFMALHLAAARPPSEFIALFLEHGEGIQIGAIVLAIALAAFVARLDMVHATMWMSSCGVAYLSLAVGLVFMWVSAPHAKLSSMAYGLVIVLMGAYGNFYVGLLLSLVIWGVCTLALVSVIRLATKSIADARSTLAAAWKDYGGDFLVPMLGIPAALAPPLALVGGAVYLLVPRISSVTETLSLPHVATVPISFTVVTWGGWLLFVLFAPFVMTFLTTKRFNYARDFRQCAASWMVPILFTGFFLVFGIFQFVTVLDDYVAISSYAIYALVLVVALAVLGGVIYVMWSVLGRLIEQLRRFIATFRRHQRIDLAEWVAAVTKASPQDQAWLLRDADPTRFGKTLEHTIEALAGLEAKIRQEPAVSVYNAKMSDLIAIRRQHRVG